MDSATTAFLTHRHSSPLISLPALSHPTPQLTTQLSSGLLMRPSVGADLRERASCNAAMPPTSGLEVRAAPAGAALSSSDARRRGRDGANSCGDGYHARQYAPWRLLARPLQPNRWLRAQPSRRSREHAAAAW